MAITDLSTLVYDDNVYAGLINQATTEKNNLVQAGVIVSNELYNSRAAGEGQLTTIPFFNPLATDEADVASADFAEEAGISEITMGELGVIRHLRSKTFGAMDVASIVSGKDVVGEIANKFGDYWSTDLTKHAMAILTGVAKLNTGLTAGDGTKVLDGSMVIDAAQTHGDAKDKFRTLVVHSAVHALMQKAEGNGYVPASQTNIGFATYYGYKLVINDRMPVAGGVYTSALLADGAFAMGRATPKHAVEFTRKALVGNGSGADVLTTRAQYILAPAGHKFVGELGKLSPTNAEQANANDWQVKFEAKNLPFAFIKSSLSNPTA
jgi:hypothetical protein